jgi:hypothetical protein
MPVSPVHILQPNQSQEHKSAAPTSARVPYVLERYEGRHSSQQSSASLRRGKHCALATTTTAHTGAGLPHEHQVESSNPGRSRLLRPSQLGQLHRRPVGWKVGEGKRYRRLYLLCARAILTLPSLEAKTLNSQSKILPPKSRPDIFCRPTTIHPRSLL